MAIDRIVELFSLISLAILSLVPVFFYLRSRIRRRSRPQEAPTGGDARPQRASPSAPGSTMQGSLEARVERERRELRLFEQATIARREQAQARIVEAEVGVPRRRGGAVRGPGGWRRIEALPPLQRAVIFSEVLGRPRGLPDEGPGDF